MQTPSVIRWAALFAVLVVGCGAPREADEATTQARPALVEIPTPNLTASEEAVREQLTLERRALDDLLTSAPTSPQLAAAFGRMGQLYHAYDLLEAAEACYRNARSLTPGDQRWAYLQGLTFERQGRLEEAATALAESLAMQPGDAATLLHLGQVNLARNDLAAARSFFQQAIESEPTCFAARFGLGEVARSRGELEQAAELFEGVLADQPSAEQVHYPLAQVLQRLGRRDEAEEHLQRVANRRLKVGGRPHCPDRLDLELADLRTGTAAAVRRGLLLGLAGEGSQELDLIRRTVEETPDDASARQRLGSLLLQTGDLDGAIEQLSQAASLDPGNPESHSALGSAQLQASEPLQAESSFRRALEIRPKSPHYRLQLASTLVQLDRCEEALPHYGGVLDTEPAHRQALLERAFCLNKLGRLEEAAADMALLLDVHPPQDPADRLRLASMLLSLSKDERALHHFEAVASSSAPAATRAQAHVLIGQVRLRQGDQTAADESFRRAAELDPLLARLPQLQQQAAPPTQ